MEVEIRVVEHPTTCAVCDKVQECARISVLWEKFEGSLNICQSCWARTLGRFTKDEKPVEPYSDSGSDDQNH